VNLLTWVLLLMAIAAPLLACWVVAVQLPGLAHSRYRHALWEIHDDILERLHTGELEAGQTVRVLIDDLDALIVTSDRQTLVRLFVASRRPVPPVQSPIVSDEALLGGDIRPCEQQYLAGVTRQVRDLMTDHLLRGSCVGWVVAAAVPMLGVRPVASMHSADVVVSRGLAQQRRPRPVG